MNDTEVVTVISYVYLYTPMPSNQMTAMTPVNRHLRRLNTVSTN